MDPAPAISPFLTLLDGAFVMSGMFDFKCSIY